jgi:hypothetical protein
MANQIVVSAGAKVRNLQDVIIGTSGVLTSLGFDVANGVPRLDVNGKILVSQLPNSVMEYKGTWNAATNTPTLVNGTGNQGDVYLCNVAGTVDFGAGAIAFVVGDQVIYSGSIWQRASGATGTVTSVGITESGDSLNITGSPITTSGTINIGFNGTNLQYVNGAGNLTTFPTLMTSVGLTMPSAFTVTNSPLTGAGGTLAVTGAGVASQYIRGDGTLADFPSSGGGGSSVSYYLNGGTSQGTIGGTTYYEMSKTAVIGTGVDFAKSGDGFIVAFLTDANDPAQLNIPAGNWNYEIYASMSSNGGTPQMYAELYVYDGTTFTLIATSSNEIIYDGTALNLYTFAMAVPATSLTLTDRLAVKLYATNSGGKTTTIHTQDGHLCQIITTFSTGITALNGLTAQVQYFQTGTNGSDFNISSTTATHTFNIPSASATNRGLITTGTQTIAGSKTFTATLYGTDSEFSGSVLSPIFSVINGTKVVNLQSLATLNRDIYLPDASGTIALTSALANYVDLTTAQTIGGTKTFNDATKNNGGIFLQNASSSSLAGYMNLGGLTNGVKFTSGGGVSNTFTLPSATGYTFTFPNATGTLALTSDIPVNPITGTGTSGQVAYFNGTTSITSESNLFWDATNDRLGIGTATPATALQVIGLTRINGATGSNYIQFDSQSTGVTPQINFFYSGGFTAILAAASSVNIGAKTTGSGLGCYLTNTSTYGGFVADKIGATGGIIAVKNTGADSLMHIASPNGFSNFLSFREDGAADRGLIGFANGTSYMQIRINGATSMTTGTLSTAFFSTGNIGINTTTDAGYKLDVNGTARVQGTTTISGDNNLIFQRATDGNSLLGIELRGSGGAERGAFKINMSTGELRIGATTGGGFFPTFYTNGVEGGRFTTGGTFQTTASVTAASAIARGVNITNTLVAAANSDVLVGLDINPTFTNGAFTGVENWATRIQRNKLLINATTDNNIFPLVIRQQNYSGLLVQNSFTGTNHNSSYNGFAFWINNDSATFKALINNWNSTGISIFNGSSTGSGVNIFGSTNNVGINQGTDAGFRLDVNGTARVQGDVDVTGLTNYRIRLVEQNNSRVTQFNTNGSSGGFNGGYEFRAGANNVYGTSTAFRIWANTATNNRIGIGNLTEANLQGGNAQVFINSQITGGRNQGIRISPAAASTTEFNGIQFDYGNLDTGGGAFIGSQSNPLTNGYDMDLVVLATMSSANSYTQIARFMGKYNSFYVGTDKTLAVPSAKLQIESTTQGFLPPRMTTTQRNAIATPATGLQVYNTTTNTNDFYNGTAWDSNAPSTLYLPLTGGTLTGALSGTSATFSSSVTSSGGRVNIQGANQNSILLNQNAGGSSTGFLVGRSFGSTDTQDFFIYDVAAASRRLEIASTGAATFSSSVTATQFLATSSSNAAIITSTGTTGYGLVAVGSSGGARDILLAGQSGVSNGFTVQYNGTAMVYIMASGNLSVSGGSVTATSFFESSDSRLKTLIHDNYQTKGIASITPKLYTKNGKVELGYYAQDFVGILDSAVSKGSDDMLSLSYREVLVAKVYALEQRIKELETK